MKIFISYSRKDETEAIRLFNELSDRGFEPWFDKNDLLAGQKWSLEIEKAIKESDFCILLLSSNSVDNRGYFHVEMKIAFKVLQTIPEEHIFIIPVRIDECTIPNKIKSFHCVDMFINWESGLEKLFKSIYSQITPEKHKDEFKKKRAYEILNNSFHDWNIFDRHEKYLLKNEDIGILTDNLKNFRFESEFIEYLLYSISNLSNQNEINIEVLNNWISNLNNDKISKIIKNILNHVNFRIRLGCVSLIDLLGNSSFLDLVMENLPNEDSNDVKKKALKILDDHNLILPEHVSKSIFRNDDDWIVKENVLKYFKETTSCLLVSDGTDFAEELGIMAEEAGFSLINTKLPLEYYTQKKWKTFDIFCSFDLIIIVKGEHFSQLIDDEFYLSLMLYVENGGNLFATSWVSWENIYNFDFTSILPFSHIGASFDENIWIKCRSTENELSKKLFPDTFSYLTSFEKLSKKENSIVLLETNESIPIFGYLKKAKGTCYYFNTCQHYCLGRMDSPFQSNLFLFKCFRNVFEWIFFNTMNDKKNNNIKSKS